MSEIEDVDSGVKVVTFKAQYDGYVIAQGFNSNQYVDLIVKVNGKEVSKGAAGNYAGFSLQAYVQKGDIVEISSHVVNGANLANVIVKARWYKQRTYNVAVNYLIRY